MPTTGNILPHSSSDCVFHITLKEEYFIIYILWLKTNLKKLKRTPGLKNQVKHKSETHTCIVFVKLMWNSCKRFQHENWVDFHKNFTWI